MIDKKKLMILGASNANYYALHEMSKLEGIELIILDGNPKSIGKEISKSFECINITDCEAVLKLAEKYKIDGIYPFNDHVVRTASYVSELLGLPGIDIVSANASLDKGTMREVWKTAGLPQPQFQIIIKEEEIYDFGEKNGYPIVIKPVDTGGGGRGVYVIKSPNKVKNGFNFASKFLYKNNRLIIEKFIEGIETSVEVVRCKRKTHLIAYSDKIKAPYSSRVAIKINYPGNFSKYIVDKIKNVSDLALKALGIKEGVGHIEFIVTKDNSIFILEIGARVGGGHTFHPIASHVSGVNYPELVANLYLGECSIPIINTYKGACYYFICPHIPGKLTSIEGLEEAKKLSNIHSIEIWKKIGDNINPLESSMERSGCIVTLAETRNEAIKVAEKANKSIIFNIIQDNNYKNKMEKIL